MAMRGVPASTAARSRTTVGAVLGEGLAFGLGSGTCLPLTVFVAGGLAVGSHFCAKKLQPNSTSADSTIASIRLRC